MVVMAETCCFKNKYVLTVSAFEVSYGEVLGDKSAMHISVSLH